MIPDAWWSDNGNWMDYSARTLTSSSIVVVVVEVVVVLVSSKPIDFSAPFPSFFWLTDFSTRRCHRRMVIRLYQLTINKQDRSLSLQSYNQFGGDYRYGFQWKSGWVERETLGHISIRGSIVLLVSMVVYFLLARSVHSLDRMLKWPWPPLPW